MVRARPGRRGVEGGRPAMMIVWGSRLYGKVDVVPGLFHVATKFGHINYFPLIPRMSFVVLRQDGDQWQGVPIPLNFKSVVFAWLRAGLLVATIIAAIMSPAMRGISPWSWAPPAIIAVACLGGFAILGYHKGATHASYDRACQLGEIVGLNDAGRALIEQHYGPGGFAPVDPFAPMN